MKIGILSDAHGNVEAFDVARRALDAVGVESTLFLGDAVGYLPGAAVVAALVAAGIPSIRGNHEAMLLARPVGVDHDDVYQLRETARTMHRELLGAIARWPTRLELVVGARRALLLHGSPTDPTFGYVYPDSELEQYASPDLTGGVVFMGNTHRPFVRRHGATTFVNVGSCGLPRDVGALGSAAVLDDDSGTVRIVRFDIREASTRALARCGPVHDDVRRTLGRRASSFVGDLVVV